MLGSGELAGELMRRGYVDEWSVVIHPPPLGAGRRLFGEVGRRLRLVGSVTTTTGVLIAMYREEGT